MSRDCRCDDFDTKIYNDKWKIVEKEIDILKDLFPLTTTVTDLVLLQAITQVIVSVNLDKSSFSISGITI